MGVTKRIVGGVSGYVVGIEMERSQQPSGGVVSVCVWVGGWVGGSGVNGVWRVGVYLRMLFLGHLS